MVFCVLVVGQFGIVLGVESSSGGELGEMIYCFGQRVFECGIGIEVGVIYEWEVQWVRCVVGGEKVDC